MTDTASERIGGEAAEDDGVDRADARAGKHRDRQLGHHRHVESDPISLAHSQGLQDVAELRDLEKELAVCEHPLLARLPFPDEGGLVLPGTRNVPVQAVH